MEDIKQIMLTKPNKKVMQDYIHAMTGKVVILQDITNISATTNQHPADLKAILERLNKKNG